MKYELTYSCGHEGVVDLIGPGKERESKLLWYKSHGSCPECNKLKLQKRYLDETEEREKVEKELGLPKLVGSEKMIQFANSLRYKLAKQIVPLDKPTTLPNPEIILHMLLTVKDAAWYINYRDDPTILIAYTRSKYFKEVKAAEESPKEEAKKFILIPDESKYPNRVKVDLKDSTVIAFSAYNKDFIEIMHSLYYQWDSHEKEWTFPLDPTTGDPIDRAAECACVLIDMGWEVLCGDELIYERALSRTWRPMYERWVGYNRKTSAFIFTLRGEQGKIIERIKQINGYAFKNKDYRVPESSFDSMMELIHEFDFKYTERAEERIRELMKEDQGEISGSE